MERLGCGVDGVKRNLILILEDNADRIAGFQRVISTLNPALSVRIWKDASEMIAQAAELLPQTILISLDHDLNRESETSVDPGTGLEVAIYLSKLPAVCPIILHSSNFERVWSMHNELTHAGWQVERVGPLGQDWIETSWLNKVRNLLQDNR